MADFTNDAIFPTCNENSHFSVSKQAVKVQFSLDMLGKITCFTRGGQAIVNSCDCSTRLRPVLQTSHTEKKMLLNQKHFFPKAYTLRIHKNILQEPINILLIL